MILLKDIVNTYLLVEQLEEHLEGIDGDVAIEEGTGEVKELKRDGAKNR